jgi:hypothetical protein
VERFVSRVEVEHCHLKMGAEIKKYELEVEWLIEFDRGF